MFSGEGICPLPEENEWILETSPTLYFFIFSMLHTIGDGDSLPLAGYSPRQRAVPDAEGHGCVEGNAAAQRETVQEYGGMENMRSLQESAVHPEAPPHFLSFAGAVGKAGNNTVHTRRQ